MPLSPQRLVVTAVPPDILGIMDEGARVIARNPGAGRPGYVRCSSLGPTNDICMKRLQFERMGAKLHEKALDTESCWRLLIGSSLHELSTKTLLASGTPCETDVEYEDPNIHLAGSMDARTFGSLPWVVEHKFVWATLLRYLKGPVRRSLYQVEGYMMISGVPRALLNYRSPGAAEEVSIHDLLRRALGQAKTSDLRQAIETALRLVSTPRVAPKPVQLRKVYAVRSDPAIRAEILKTLQVVNDACSSETWLEENRKHCDLCPFQPPCHSKRAFKEVELAGAA